MSRPSWVSDDRRPYFGPKVLDPHSHRAQVVHLPDSMDDYYWKAERVNLISDPADPRYRLADPIRIVAGYGGDAIKFANEFDDFRHSYRDVRVIDYPP